MDFLEKYGTGAISALCREWTDEEIKDLAREEGYEDGFDAGKKQGIEQGIERGIEQGIEQGMARGESRLAELQSVLWKADRFEDVKRSISDPAYRAQLFKEFGLEE